MPRTFIRQDIQIKNSDVYDDTVAPTLAAFETNPAELETDLNNMRSMLSYLKDIQSGNWYDDQTAPTTLDTGTLRGVDDLNDGLHLIEKKRVLADVFVHIDVTVTAAQNYEILLLGELPTNTIAAIGSVTTLGTVAAFHTGTFGTHSLDLVSGPSAVEPLNLGAVVDSATHDPVLSAGRQVWALFQVEENTDGLTMTGTTTKRAQLSFVRLNAGGTALEACPVVDIAGLTVHYWVRERKRLEDLTESDFLRGASIDIGAGSTTVTRQVSYDNQGTTPVDVTTNSTLDLEGPGLVWSIRDDLEADLLRIIEGSAGGTSEVEISAGVDLYDNNAVDVDFASGASINSGGTRPIDVGVTDGIIESTAGDLGIAAAAELLLDDVNQTGSTWAQTTGIKLSETTAEWDAFEVAFGEVSLLNAIVAAKDLGTRTKVQAVVTAAVAADADVNLPVAANVDVQLPAYDAVPNSFVDDVEVWVNGILNRNGANAAANEDVYPGTLPASGDLKFEYALKASPGNADVITVIVNGQ